MDLESSQTYNITKDPFSQTFNCHSLQQHHHLQHSYEVRDHMAKPFFQGTECVFSQLIRFTLLPCKKVYYSVQCGLNRSLCGRWSSAPTWLYQHVHIQPAWHTGDPFNFTFLVLFPFIFNYKKQIAI